MGANQFVGGWRCVTMLAAGVGTVASLVGCSGESIVTDGRSGTQWADTTTSERAVRSRSALTTVCTPEMPIGIKKILSSHVIKTGLKPPFLPQLFLSDVTITEITWMTGVTGIIHPGSDAQHGGSATLQVSSSIYSNLAVFMTNNSGLALDICYDDVTLVPNEVSCGLTQ